MPNHIRLFERPLVADEVLPALMVMGVLPDYTPEAAYEGRLPILNSVGKCTVEVLESTLPPGAFVRVDNITKEVVVKWAAYKEEEESVSVVPGGDFEDGGTEGWYLGPGWSIGTGPDYDVKSGTYSARFAGVKTKGSDLISPRVPAKVNDYIRVTAQVQQGASAKGNAGARVSLIYRNEEGSELLRLWGNLITSGSNGAWKETIAEGAAPAGTATVEVVLSAYRNRENHALWVDDVVWNHKYTVGQDNDNDYYLRIKVTDSANRDAYWSGSIGIEATYVIGQLYPVPVYDSARAYTPSAVIRPGAGAVLQDYSVTSMPGIVSLSRLTATIRVPVIEDSPAIADAPRIVGMFSQSAVNRVVLPKEDYVEASMPILVEGTSAKVVVRTSGYVDSTKTGMPSIIGITKT